MNEKTSYEQPRSTASIHRGQGRGKRGERVSFAKSIAALESKSKDVERESSREGRCEESIREEPVPSQTSKIE